MKIIQRIEKYKIPSMKEPKPLYFTTFSDLVVKSEKFSHRLRLKSEKKWYRLRYLAIIRNTVI